MVFGVAELISVISQTMTLAPGDVHPDRYAAGCGHGDDPARGSSASGDVLEVEIDRLGRLVTTMAGPAA